MSTTSGWGRFTWGQAYWNADTTLKTGWGAQAWSDGEWGELKDAIALPTGLSITSSIGSVDIPDQIITPSSFEITNTSGTAYTAGGATLTNSGVSLSSTTAFTDFSDVTFSSASFTANGALIYNTTTDGGSGTTDAVCAIAFGGDKTASNGTFKIEFPTNDATAAIIRLA